MGIIAKYGAGYGGVMVALFVLSYLLIGVGPETFDIEEKIGYGTMILTSAAVIMGIRAFRDRRNGGRLSFGQGLRVGAGISAVGGLIFGAYNFILVTWIYPEFYEEYMTYYAEKIRSSGRAAEAIAAELQKLEATPEWMGSALGQGVVMFVTVFAIGFVVAVIGSVALRRSKG
jgi:hypothetical protein